MKIDLLYFYGTLCILFIYLYITKRYVLLKKEHFHICVNNKL